MFNEYRNIKNIFIKSGRQVQHDVVITIGNVCCLQNLAFQAAQKLRSQILSGLGTDQLFRLLCDRDVNVLLKTLGLLRNLLSSKPVGALLMTAGSGTCTSRNDVECMLCSHL